MMFPELKELLLNKEPQFGATKMGEGPFGKLAGAKTNQKTQPKNFEEKLVAAEHQKPIDSEFRQVGTSRHSCRH